MMDNRQIPKISKEFSFISAFSAENNVSRAKPSEIFAANIFHDVELILEMYNSVMTMEKDEMIFLPRDSSELGFISLSYLKNGIAHARFGFNPVENRWVIALGGKINKTIEIKKLLDDFCNEHKETEETPLTFIRKIINRKEITDTFFTAIAKLLSENYKIKSVKFLTVSAAEELRKTLKELHQLLISSTSLTNTQEEMCQKIFEVCLKKKNMSMEKFQQEFGADSFDEKEKMIIEKIEATLQVIVKSEPSDLYSYALAETDDCEYMNRIKI